MKKVNNKSTVKYVVLPKLPQTPKQSRSAVKSSNAKSHSVEYLSRQPKSKKSPTGASYNDGFDVVNTPVKPKVRYEDFDELCETLNGSEAYVNKYLDLNPGQALVFPRLSNFAKLYDRYRFTKLEAYFQHTVSQFDSQGSRGLVILSALYDAASTGPTSKKEQEMTNPHVMGMPNQNILLRMDPQRLHPSGYPLFTRAGLKPGGTDIKSYDAGKVWIGTQGMTGAGEVGEIHLRGTVAFYDEIVDTQGSDNPIQTSLSEFQSVTNNSIPNSTVTSLLMTSMQANGLQVNSLGDSFIPPPGEYLVTVRASFYNVGASMTYIVLQLVKNGNPYGYWGYYNGAPMTRQEVVIQHYMRFDGSDTVKCQTLCTFPTGTTTAIGVIDFLIL